MHVELELARAVFPGMVTASAPVLIHRAQGVPSGTTQAFDPVPPDVFDPLGAHFADVLAWLTRQGFRVACAYRRDASKDALLVTHDGTAHSLKQAVYEVAIRAIKEGKR